MASSPFHIEDQTDEDFFNKLVEDDFSAGSGSDKGNIAGSFSSVTNGDKSVSYRNSEDLGCAIVEENRVDHAEIQLPRVPENGSSKSFPSVNEDKPSGSAEEKQGTCLMHDLDNALASGSNGSKGTGVRAVNWSAFNVDSQQFDSGEFGSMSDFPTDNEIGSKKELAALDDKSSGLLENSSDYSACFGSSAQEDARYINSASEQVAEVHDPQYWENLYPGWKFDATTQQWYQLKDCHVESTSESDYYTSAAVQQPDHNEVLERRSETCYLQQTVSSVVDNIVQDCSINDASNWHQVSYENSKYPPNMVFDPGYPGWYYDTNAQQWYTLDSYTQMSQGAVDTQHEPLNQGMHSSNIIAEMDNCKLENKIGQYEEDNAQHRRSYVVATDQDGSRQNCAREQMWHPNQAAKSTMDFSGDYQQNTYNNLASHSVNHTDQQVGHKNLKPLENFDFGSTNDARRFQSYTPSESMHQFDQPKLDPNLQATLSHSQYDNQKGAHHPNPSYSQYASVSHENRSSATRPPHALVAFGFGGKLIVMKDSSSFISRLDYGIQDTAGPSISILNLIDIITSDIDYSSSTHEKFKYFQALCQSSFPGPLVGGNASTKDVNKWADDQIAMHQSPLVNSREDLLLSLLKISCQHYGKLRSPFNFNSSIEDTDSPESAVAKLFSSVNKNGTTLQKHEYVPLCIQNLPTEGQLQATSLEVQRLLVSGRQKEALQCAQTGQLWGPALVLSAQFGEKYYVETVKKMAHNQFTTGSPLRTLYLLIAGQPAEVFSTESSLSSTTVSNALQESSKVLANGMLDDWERNVAIIAANRTKDDELVIVHLGDCLWKEKGQISAAHTCYLVAEVNLEPYSESARMCLLGADHWKLPRTYVSPKAIQRTELYEYSKVLGNSQFILLSFQPYKLVYAYMLAEVGKVSDSLRYCQTSLKLLKNSNRVPEVELWKSLFSSLEERARTHQQGGYNSTLDPTKLVGKLFTSIDRSISRIIGAPQSPMLPLPQGNGNGKENFSNVPKVANSQSTMEMSSLIQSGSEAVNESSAKSNRKIIHNRSVSEPDFGRALKQDQLKDGSSPGSESKASRLGRFGSQILLKTVGWVSRSRPDRQAKLGETNKFYYDDKLKRWVEEGAEPPTEGTTLLPPPTTATFQNGMTNFNSNTEFKTPTSKTNGVEAKPTGILACSTGIPPISPNLNQFSTRGRMGVRSRYVDTFNKGGISLNTSPSTPIVKPTPVNVFLPGKPSTFDPQIVGMETDKALEASTTNESSTTLDKEVSYSSAQAVTSSIQRLPSMDSITFYGSGGVQKDGRRSSSSHSRAASWGSSYGNAFSFAEVKSWEDGPNE